MKTQPRLAALLAAVTLVSAGTAVAVLTTPARGSRPKAMTMPMTTGAMPMPVPIQPIGQARWQGMKISARLSTPLPFYVFQGTSERLVKPTKKDDVHLMVMLNDAQTGAAIPYGSVWATVADHGKLVFDDRLWPMISRYMGTHYGDNVALPGTGTYTLTLLVGPPQAARHVEYSKVWLKPHRITLTFHWNKPK